MYGVNNCINLNENCSNVKKNIAGAQNQFSIKGKQIDINSNSNVNANENNMNMGNNPNPNNMGFINNLLMQII